jgi:hypothetical protein
MLLGTWASKSQKEAAHIRNTPQKLTRIMPNMLQLATLQEYNIESAQNLKNPGSTALAKLNPCSSGLSFVSKNQCLSPLLVITILTCHFCDLQAFKYSTWSLIL